MTLKFNTLYTTSMYPEIVITLVGLNTGTVGGDPYSYWEVVKLLTPKNPQGYGVGVHYYDYNKNVTEYKPTIKQLVQEMCQQLSTDR